MRILEHEELPSEAEAQAQLLDLTAGWGTMDFHRLDEARRMGYPSADYLAIYAVENDEIISAVRALRLPITTSEGVQQAAGIQGVVTRRDMKGKGLARRLLEEVHRREKAAESRYSLLWTGRAMIAHGLYESLGYRDVYTPELAILRRPKGGAGREAIVIRKARNEDVDYIEGLHTEATAERIGFTPRPSGVVRSLLHVGLLEAESLKILLRSGKAVGYAVLQKHQGGSWWSLEELVLAPGTQPAEVLPVLESTASGGWFVIRNTVVRDLGHLLRNRGYRFSPYAYYSLLALPLKKPSENIVDELGTKDKSFTCQHLDYF